MSVLLIVGAAFCREDRGLSSLRRNAISYEGREPSQQKNHSRHT